MSEKSLCLNQEKESYLNIASLLNKFVYRSNFISLFLFPSIDGREGSLPHGFLQACNSKICNPSMQLDHLQRYRQSLFDHCETLPVNSFKKKIFSVRINKNNTNIA